ncbi:hypothetical protein EJ08DRAFT_647152, partial [Tothia fuscella]
MNTTCMSSETLVVTPQSNPHNPKILIAASFRLPWYPLCASLMGIAAELRNRILQHLLPDTDPHLNIVRITAPPNAFWKSWWQVSKLHCLRKEGSNPWLHLVQVNRQLCEEGTHLLYHQRTFHLRITERSQFSQDARHGKPDAESLENMLRNMENLVIDLTGFANIGWLGYGIPVFDVLCGELCNIGIARRIKVIVKGTASPSCWTFNPARIQNQADRVLRTVSLLKGIEHYEIEIESPRKMYG